MCRKTVFFSIFILVSIVGIITLDVRYASSGIQGGYHDLSFTGAGGWTYPVDGVCYFCHTPHAANMNETYDQTGASTSAGSLNGKYLWNRRLPVAASFQTYSSPTMHVATGAPGTLSLLCLSCHDGVGAVNVLLNYPDDATLDSITGLGTKDQFGNFNPGDLANWRLNIGDANCGAGDACAGPQDLRNDHPIGFLYATAQAADPTGLNAALPAALQTRMSLTGGRMECNTCHDPHVTNNASLKNKFLVMSNSGSAMCLGCHNK